MKPLRSPLAEFRSDMMQKPIRPFAFLILALVALGVFLRFYQLGHDNLWSDEVSVYNTASEPTYLDFFRGIQSYAMAMPLDYVLCRFAILFGTSEFILRLSSAIWGCLTVLVYAWLAIRHISHRHAVIVTGLVALAPALIHYSQELRFYSALIFFYGLASALVLHANRNSTRQNWLVYIFIASIGIYFHPYVLLSTLVGWLDLKTPPGRKIPPIRALVPLFISTLALGLIFLPGYLLFKDFGRVQYFTVLKWSTLRDIVVGLGLLSPGYTPEARAFGGWEALLVVGLLRGIYVLWKRPDEFPAVRALLLAGLLQILLILGADEKEHYWFAPRQILHLLPTVLLVSGLGLTDATLAMVRKATAAPSSEPTPRFAPLALGVLVLLILTSGGMRVREYYAYPKNNGKAIAAAMLEAYRPGDRVLASPRFRHRVFEFYMNQLADSKTQVPQLYGKDFISGHALTVDEIRSFMPAPPSKLLLALDYKEAHRVMEFEAFHFEVIERPDVEWGLEKYLLSATPNELP